MNGLKENELRELARCSICKRLVGETRFPILWKVTSAPAGKRRNVPVRFSARQYIDAAITAGEMGNIGEANVSYLSDLFDGLIAEASLTPRQFQTLRLLRASKGRQMPSQRELAARLGLRSQAAAGNLLRHLEAKGFIKRDKYESRAIRLL